MSDSEASDLWDARHNPSGASREQEGNKFEQFRLKEEPQLIQRKPVNAPPPSEMLGFASSLQQGKVVAAKPKQAPKAQGSKNIPINKGKMMELDDFLVDSDEESAVSGSSDEEEESIDSEDEEDEEDELLEASPQKEETLMEKRQRYMMNPEPQKRKRRLVVMDDSDDEADEKVKDVISLDDEDSDVESVHSVASRKRKNSSDSNSDEDEESENSTVTLLMARCESISENLSKTLAVGGRSDMTTGTLMDEAGAQAMIGNENLALKPYQIAGVNWLSVLHHENINGVLADEMGLGKTVQAVAFLRLLYTRNGVRGPHLIVAPASTVENWHRELLTWLPELNCELYNGSQQERAELRKQVKRRRGNDVDIWITTYTYFERESCKEDRQFLSSLNFNVCIYDEAHAIKNTESQRYQSLMQLQSKRRLLLSGTPVQNKLDELFALLSFCLPSIFNPKKSKLRRKVFGMESDPARVRRILSPFILRRLKSQVLSQLSPKEEDVQFVEMLPEQKRMYDQVVRDFAKFRLQSEEERNGRRKKNASDVATSESIFTELRKIANHPLMVKHRFGGPGRDLQVVAAELHRAGYFGKQATLKMVKDEIASYSDWDLNACCLQFPKNTVLKNMVLPEEDMFDISAKAAKLQTLVPELVSQGHRVLLFSQWTKLLDVFEELLSQLEVGYMRLDGSTAVDERQTLVDEFNRGLAPVFLLSTRAGGLGINLTSADVVILHDLDFNPSIDSQAMDRCHRIGQKKKVRVIKLVCLNTVDEAIYRLQLKKTGLNKVVLGEEDNARSGTSTSEVLLPNAKDFEEGVAVDEKQDEADQKAFIQNALQEACTGVSASGRQ